MSALGRLLALPGMARQVRRLRQVLGVAVRYGFGHVLDRVGLASLVRLGRDVEADATLADRRWEVRLRMALEELGPTFIKLGQALATRPDLVPMSLIEELRRLQDDVPPFDSELAQSMIVSELGQPIDRAFAHFERKPIAAASIAQVHRARLHDGTWVVVKLQRPGLDERIRRDLELITFVAGWLEQQLPEVRRFKPVEAIEELARNLKLETDFGNELRNIERFRQQLVDHPRMVVPRTWPELSTRRMLVMEFLDGCRITDRARLAEWGVDPVQIAEFSTHQVISSIFEHGFFHGDPHEGNFLVLRDGRLGVLDFGMMGSLDRERIDELLTFMAALLLGDAELLVAQLMDLGLLGDSVNVRRLRGEVSTLMGRYHGVDIQSVEVSTFLGEAIEVITRHDIDLPSDLLLIGKALSTMEGIARQIHPTFNPLVDLRPVFVRLYLARALDPETYSRRITRTARDWWSLANVVPGELRAILRRARRGEIRFEVADPGLDRLLEARDRQVNRVILTATTLAAWGLFAALLPTAELRGWWSPTTWWALLLALTGFWTGGLLGISLLRSRAI